MEKAIDSIRLDKMTYRHTGTGWPTLQTMIDSNQRLVLFVESDKLPRAAYLMRKARSTQFSIRPMIISIPTNLVLKSAAEVAEPRNCIW